MADDERHDRDDGPSLELPNLRSALGFRRKRTNAAAAEARDTEPPSDPEPPAQPQPPTEPETPVPPRQPEPGPDISPGPAGLPETQPEVDPTAVLTAARSDLPSPPRARRRLRLHLPGPVAALVAGAVAGLALVGLTSAGMHGCTAVRGTSSCGTPGLVILVVIAAAVVLLGSLLLRVAGVHSHGSTSFLGVGLLVVLILLALLPVVDQWWMVIVVPALAMLTYAASWWLTTTYTEPGERSH